MGGVVSRRVLIAAAALFANPCVALATTVTFPDFPSPSPGKLIAFGDDDLAISAYPLTDSQDQKTYFGLDLSGAGVLPIWLSITDRSSTKRFLVDAEDIKLAYGEDSIQEAERSHSTIDDSGATAVENVAAVGMAAGPIGLAVSLPILLISGDELARQDEIRRNLMVRQFYSRTIGPAQSAVGFVYGKRGQQDADLSKFRLSIGVKLIPAPPDSAGVIFESVLAPQTPNAPIP
jgi:hypothetical protein